MILDFFINSAQAIDKIPFTSSVGLNPLLEKMGCVSTNTDFLGCYINTLYTFFVQAAVILAVLMILVGGMQWLLAIGNQGKIGNAKSTISGAIVGLILALTAYVILAQINSGLIYFKPLGIESTNVPSIIKEDNSPYLLCGNGEMPKNKCEDTGWCRWVEGRCQNNYYYGERARIYFEAGNTVYDYYCCTLPAAPNGTPEYDIIAVPLIMRQTIMSADNFCKLVKATNNAGAPDWKSSEFLSCKKAFNIP